MDPGNLAGRYSRQLSDRLPQGLLYDGWSYYLSVSRLDPRVVTTANIYGGPDADGICLNFGISLEQLNKTADTIR